MQSIGILKASSLIGIGKWHDRWYCWHRVNARVSILIMHPELGWSQPAWVYSTASSLHHLHLSLFAFKQKPLLRAKSSNSASHLTILNCPSLKGPLSLQRAHLRCHGLCSQWPDAEISLYKQAAGCVSEDFAFWWQCDKISPYPGFNKTFPCNLR